MGILFSCASLSCAIPDDGVVKLVHCDGLVEEFYRPVRVNEHSVYYPHHRICSLGDVGSMHRSGFLRKLSEEDSMEIGQVYFLIPAKAFEVPLSKTQIMSLSSKAGFPKISCYKDLQVAIASQANDTPREMFSEAEAVEQEVDPSSASSQIVQRPQPKSNLSRETILKLIEETRLELESKSKCKRIFPATSTTDLRHDACPREHPHLRSGIQTADAGYMLERSCNKLWRPPLETIKEDGMDVC
ncbi:hypothetical protein KP509_24G013000 [Ceratopteris richardii]|uniref:Uncharacterized protein n=1 Tax=Ceratopteris richardii TaxID=49495 RepID=A0A8T2RUZ9_CERRI|nr:hypothetical protein KP509_24G013000 [Ceratopteris richardii]